MQPALFFVIRESETGEKKLRDLLKRTFRFLLTDRQARIQTMLYHPFPESCNPIIEVHVLVTESNKPQRYFVIDLSLGATLKKNQTLKRGSLYKLDNKRFGTVELVPIEKK
jgi:hypothetical protein